MSAKNISILNQINSSKEQFIIGIDECSTGSWAGSIYVSAVKAPKNWTQLGLNDSKKLSPARREKIYQQLISCKELSYAIAYCEANKLDYHMKNGKNLHYVLRELYKEAIDKLDISNSTIVLDGLLKIPNINHFSLPKADSLMPVVMAASIIAKVNRDAHMLEMSKIYPAFKFEKHNGYGTKEHREVLERLGPCAIHRFSYKPINNYVIEQFKKANK